MLQTSMRAVIIMSTRMRQVGGFYAMKQHTDRSEPRSGEVLEIRGADVFFEHRSDG